jgi:hypothetical protein
MPCFAPRPGKSEPVSGGVHLPGNALGCSSLVEGEKTEFTSSDNFVQPGGGSFFAFAHAVTINVRIWDLVEYKVSYVMLTLHLH